MVLIVEDDPEVAELLTTTVAKRLGCMVLRARDADEAVAVLADRLIDVVVSDCEMPGVRGAVLARRIRSSWPDTAVILISGSEPAEAALESGAAEFLAKPFHPLRLVEAILRQLERAAGPSQPSSS